jgi:hypothetical protein
MSQKQCYTAVTKRDITTMVIQKECKKSYNTDYSQVVSHPSTRPANTRLTSEIGRDPVKLMCMVVAENENSSLILSFYQRKDEDVLASHPPEEDAVSNCHHEEVRLLRQSSG